MYSNTCSLLAASVYVPGVKDPLLDIVICYVSNRYKSDGKK